MVILRCLLRVGPVRDRAATLDPQLVQVCNRRADTEFDSPRTEVMTAIHGFSGFLLGCLTRRTLTGGRRIGFCGMLGGYAQL